MVSVWLTASRKNCKIYCVKTTILYDKVATVVYGKHYD